MAGMACIPCVGMDQVPGRLLTYLCQRVFKTGLTKIVFHVSFIFFCFGIIFCQKFLLKIAFLDNALIHWYFVWISKDCNVIFRSCGAGYTCLELPDVPNPFGDMQSFDTFSDAALLAFQLTILDEWTVVYVKVVYSNHRYNRLKYTISCNITIRVYHS